MGVFESSTWSLIPGGITAPIGFNAAGISAGLKPSNKLDLALIFAPPDAVCSGTFTQSIARAKCVDLCVERLFNKAGKVRAILINSGQANACTGSKGLDDSLIATKKLAEKLRLEEEEVLICSTGVIGEPINMQNLLIGLSPLVQSLNREGSGDAAQAILTTDLQIKEIAIEGYLGSRRVRIGGIAKGSGMIHPNMATMLAFLTCDVGLPHEFWNPMVKEIANSSFNSISVDGDTSTNDAFLAFCAGERLNQEYFDELQIGLTLVSTYLAQSIARDGEGANCLIEVRVQGAQSIAEGNIIARTISSSSLVKTAIHGCDPNWGRIIAAAGRAGVDFDLTQVSLWIGSFQLMEKGRPIQFNKEEVVQYLKIRVKETHLQDELVLIRLRIGSSKNESIAWGCDLSSEYVHINADYTT